MTGTRISAGSQKMTKMLLQLHYHLTKFLKRKTKSRSPLQSVQKEVNESKNSKEIEREETEMRAKMEKNDKKERKVWPWIRM